MRTTVQGTSDNVVNQESLLQRCLPQERWEMEILGSPDRGPSSEPP